jgi:hypothetical protein
METHPEEVQGKKKERPKSLLELTSVIPEQIRHYFIFIFILLIF